MVDTCAFAPEAVASLLDALSPAIGRYALVTSVSVYADFKAPGVSEDSPASRATPEQLEMARALPPEQRSTAASYAKAYGPLKRECELVALERLGERALILRSGLLVGAGDYTDRLTSWVRRVDQGGAIPAPGDPQRLVQLVDVRDAARFIVEAAERNSAASSTSPAAPSRSPTSWRPSAASLVPMRASSGAPTRRCSPQGWNPGPRFPSGCPTRTKPSGIFWRSTSSKAFAHGFKPRPLDETLRQILAWDRTRRDTPLKAGMPPEKEAALLADPLRAQAE